jgi:hypothetical protein
MVVVEKVVDIMREIEIEIERANHPVVNLRH